MEEYTALQNKECDFAFIEDENGGQFIVLSEPAIQLELNDHDEGECKVSAEPCITEEHFDTSLDLCIQVASTDVEDVRVISPDRGGSFKTWPYMEAQLVEHASLLRCPLCEKVLPTEEQFLKHMQSHERKTFTCPECEKTFSLKGNLQKHMLVHSNTKDHHCLECGKTFRAKGSLTKHQLTHGGTKDYGCPACDKQFRLKGNLKKHLLTHVKPFSCSECDETFSTNNALVKHTVRKHSSPEQCPLCDKQFHTSRYYRQHLASHRQNIEHRSQSTVAKTPLPRNVDPCSEVNYDFKSFSSNSEAKHKENSGNIPAYSCGTCLKCFHRKDVLIKHEKTHRKFSCSRCKLSFHDESSLQIHQSLPCGAKLSCPVCAEIFSKKGSLIRHLSREHRGYRPFSCDVCSESFTRKDSLQRHILRHRNIKPHKCEYCGKCFTSAWNLKTHRFIHSGDLPYKCKFCGNGFRSTWNRNVHILTHTGEKPYRCDLCMKRYPTYTTLRIHKQTHIEHIATEEDAGVHPSKFGLNARPLKFKKRWNRKMVVSDGQRSIRKTNVCPRCSKSFWLLESLQSHVLTHRKS